MANLILYSSLLEHYWVGEISFSFIDILIDRPIISLSMILIITFLVYLRYHNKKIKAKKNLDLRLYPNTF